MATTENGSDDEIVEVAAKSGITCFRGSEHDVLSRYHLAAKKSGLDTVIRITSDCPYIDPHVIEDLIELYDDGGYDYASNCIKRTFPHGIDCEIFSFDALDKVNSIADEKFYREHVTSYFYTHPEEFSLGSLYLEDEDFSDVRITVDTKQDYALACVLKENLKPGRESFREIIAVFEEKPYIKFINEDMVQKRRYESVEEELEAAIEILEKQELMKSAEILKKQIGKKDIRYV